MTACHCTAPPRCLRRSGHEECHRRIGHNLRPSVTIVSANTSGPGHRPRQCRHPAPRAPGASSRRPGASGSAPQRSQDHRDRRRARRLPSPQGPADSDHRAGQAVRDRQAPVGLPQARREGCPHRPASSEAVRGGRRLRLPRPQLPPNPHNRPRSQGGSPPRTRPLPPPRPRSADSGAAAMRRWYTKVGGQWLRHRIRPWAARLGEEAVEVEVRDLGYRWGSARPATGPQRINVHWATLQLPPSLIDYVLVHELAHLRQTNHTPEFWQTVARMIPTYEHHKATIATIGKTIWLGSVQMSNVTGFGELRTSR